MKERKRKKCTINYKRQIFHTKPMLRIFQFA